MLVIGLISDTHGWLRPQVLEAFRPCSLILHAGDIGNAQVLERLRQLCPVVAVRGNVDRGDWAQALPATELVEAGTLWIYMLHDVTTLDLVPEAADIQLVLSGHTHKPSCHQRKGVTYLNPGSAGPRRFNLPATAAMLYIQGESLETRWILLE